MTRARRALATAIAAVAVAGCSGADGPSPPAEPPATTGTGYFVGRDAAGLGASVDLLGVDPVSRAIRGAFAPDRRSFAEAPVVAIASVVNEGSAPVRTPRFVAVMRSGALVPMPAARRRLSRGVPADREALRMLGPPRPRVPVGGSAAVYLLLRGADPLLVASVRMVSEPGQPIVLEARSR